MERLQPAWLHNTLTAWNIPSCMHSSWTPAKPPHYFPSNPSVNSPLFILLFISLDVTLCSAFTLLLYPPNSSHLILRFQMLQSRDHPCYVPVQCLARWNSDQGPTGPMRQIHNNQKQQNCGNVGFYWPCQYTGGAAQLQVLLYLHLSLKVWLLQHFLRDKTRTMSCLCEHVNTPKGERMIMCKGPQNKA